VIDVSGAYIEGEIKNIETKGNLVKSVRCANQSGNVARVVVDLQQKLNHKIIKSENILLYTYPEHLFRKILQFLCPAAEAPAKMKGQGTIFFMLPMNLTVKRTKLF